MRTKAEFLNEFDQEVQDWENLIAEIGENNLETLYVAEQWTVKDVVAHLTGWRKRTVARLQATKRGDPEPPGPWPAHLQNDDEINAWIYESNRHRSTQEVLAESKQVIQQLRNALEAFSEDELNDPKGIRPFEEQPVTANYFFGHFHEEHEADLRRVANKQ
jgi:hypothetical protein